MTSPAHVWLAVALGALAVVAAMVVADRLKRRRDQAQASLKAVRSMLSDDPDAAIEALSGAARLGNPEAIETYLALGALFRRTGDFARAVRLHRNILLGPGLDPARRAEVERELAEDHRRSGMLADAAALLAPQAARGDRGAMEALRDVLAEQGDLRRAAEVQRRLSGGVADPLLAHLLAAVARDEVAARRPSARETAHAAVAAHPASAAALLAMAEAEGAAGDDAAAIDAAGRALDADGRAALLAWPALRLVRDPLALVERRLARAPEDAALHLLHGRALHRAGRAAAAFAALSRALELDATGEVTLAMRELLREAGAPGADDLAARHDLLVKALVHPIRRPRCGRCGGDAVARTWRCGRCGAFDAWV